MSLSPRNEPPEDIQELISSTSPNCSPSAAPRDMKSGRGWGDGGASSRTSTSEQRVIHGEEEASRSTGFWARYFSVSLLLLLGVTASLVILPLVLPPLPPPPSMLLLVPVAMLLVLLVLAFMPTSSGGRSGTGLA